MKNKKMLFIGLFCLIIAVIMIVVFLPKESKSNIEDIEVSKLITKFENKESFILFIGSQNCSHCKVLRPILDEALIEEELTAYYIDLYNLSDEEKDQVFKHVNYTHTPTLAFITDGVENAMRRLTGSAYTAKQLIEQFEKTGFIK